MVKPVSKYGFKVRFDHEFPEKWEQYHRPTLFQIWNMIGTIIRYVLYMIYTLLQGKQPIMNFFRTVKPQRIYGVPIGGIGGGSINRGFKGEFCRYQMVPGIYEYKTLHANQFILTVHSETGCLIYSNVLSPYSAPADGSLSSWKWNFPKSQGHYTGLYPRAWYEYEIPAIGLRLVCRQVSPVIPHNYKDSCVPGCVFVWDVENSSSQVYKVSLTFTFQNGRGNSQDVQGGCSSETFQTDSIQGVHILDKMNGMAHTYTISTRQKKNVSSCSYFNPKGNGSEIWTPLQANGELSSTSDPTIESSSTEAKTPHVTRRGECLGVAVSIAQTVSPASSSSSSYEFALIWTKKDGTNFRNRSIRHAYYYTSLFQSTNLSVELSDYALRNYSQWERDIDAWQDPILSQSDVPDWYKSCVLNELYFVSDGGTVWFTVPNTDARLEPDDVRKVYGRFAYLEGHEYRMYNTYDVHFYASISLAKLWPKLEQCLQMDFRDSVYLVNSKKRWIIYSGEFCERKKSTCVPHDVGDPEEEPFSLVNAYNIYDVSNWRDLNLKFIVSVYRDFHLTQDKPFLAKMYPCVLDLINKSQTFDKDGLGIIQNGGFPDQTFDCWTMTGVSAYCGGLYIAALACIAEMAQLMSDSVVHNDYKLKVEKAVQVYNDLLWTGDYYKFDSSGSGHSASIMADQLCGHLFLKTSGLNMQVFPRANVLKALNTIFKFNVEQYFNGEMGAVNGKNPDGTQDKSALQSEEVWTGVTYSLAATMLYEGMEKEAWRTAGGLYRTVYEKSGLGYETPEGLVGSDKTYRAGGYMRALAVYALQVALEDTRMKPK